MTSRVHGDCRAAKREDKRWVCYAFRLVAGTMLYNIIEAIVGLWSGFRAGSIALVGFSFDSLIEIAAGGAVLWRLRTQALGATEERIERAEVRVRRFVGATFIALSAYVLAESVMKLWTRQEAAETVVGIVLALASLIVMPLVAAGKLRIGRVLQSKALLAEAKETLACSYLSLTLLVGLLATAFVGWWWADAVAALLMVPWLIREGAEGFAREED